jgi:hypothetical protein
MEPIEQGGKGEGRRALGMLAVGAVVGLALAAHGLIADDVRRTDALPQGVVARVNGSDILTDDYLRLVAGLERDTRESADVAVRRHVLDRMIDEEVLVQRGLELGLAESDRRIRANVTAAMIRSILVEVEDQQPTGEELREFYDEQRDFFTQPGRMRVHQLFFRVPDPAQQQAVGASGRAGARGGRGEPTGAVRDWLPPPAAR